MTLQHTSEKVPSPVPGECFATQYHRYVMCLDTHGGPAWEKTCGVSTRRKIIRHVRQSQCITTTKSCGARGSCVDLGPGVSESDNLEQCCAYHFGRHVETHVWPHHDQLTLPWPVACSLRTWLETLG